MMKRERLERNMGLENSFTIKSPNTCRCERQFILASGEQNHFLHSHTTLNAINVFFNLYTLHDSVVSL